MHAFLFFLSYFINFYIQVSMYIDKYRFIRVVTPLRCHDLQLHVHTYKQTQSKMSRYDWIKALWRSCETTIMLLTRHTIILTHWGWVTYIHGAKLTIIVSDNGRRQAIIWSIAGISLIWHLLTNFGVMLIEIKSFTWKPIRWKMPSAKCRP